MFENYTPEMLKNRILGRLQSKLETREGSVTNDQVSAVSYELWIAYQMMDALIPIFYVDETSGIYLDKQAGDFGVVRKSGAFARAAIRFTGKDGTTVPAGMSFHTKSGLCFILTEDVTLVDGAGTGILEAEKVGEAYNIDAGEITSILRNVSGLTGYENDAATGGVDVEATKDYLVRYKEFLANPPTSGNGYHYQQWAMEVDGIGAARVVKTWNGGGTVKCILASADMEPVDDAIVAAAEKHIEAECPVGAEPTCVSAKSQEITVSASIVLAASANLETIQAAMASNLDAYLRQIVKPSFAVVIDPAREALDDYAFRVLYSRIGFQLLAIDGVLDYSGLTVNGGTKNVVMPYDTIPVAGTVTLISEPGSAEGNALGGSVLAADENSDL